MVQGLPVAPGRSQGQVALGTGLPGPDHAPDACRRLGVEYAGDQLARDRSGPRERKTDNGIVTVTTVWTDGRVYYPLHATPCTPAHHFACGRSDPAFRTKPQLAAALAARGKEADSAAGR